MYVQFNEGEERPYAVYDNHGDLIDSFKTKEEADYLVDNSTVCGKQLWENEGVHPIDLNEGTHRR